MRFCSLLQRRIFYTLTEVGIVAYENVGIYELAEKLSRCDDNHIRESPTAR